MFSEQNRQHPEWELSRQTQRRVTLGVTLLLAFIVAIQLISGAPYDFWNEGHGATVVTKSDAPYVGSQIAFR